jgi:hypothetical protein
MEKTLCRWATSFKINPAMMVSHSPTCRLCSMFEVDKIWKEVVELRENIEKWHVQAWKHRLNGDREHMKIVHRRIKTAKYRIKECEWMINRLLKCSANVAWRPMDMFCAAMAWYALLRTAEFMFFSAM